MVEKARLELEVDSRQAKQGVDQLDKGFDGLGKSATAIIGRLTSIETRLDEIGKSSRTTAQGTQVAARGFSQIALNGQRTNETLQRLERNLLDVARNSRQATTENQKFSRSLGGTARTAGQLRSALGGLFAGVSGAFVLRDATRVIAGFEQSLATLRGVTGLDAASQQFTDLQDQARSLGASTRFTAQQAAEGQVFLARAGFQADEIFSALPATLSLAAAGQLELGQAADIASNAVTQFNLSASDTGRVADSLVNVANNANTNVAQLAEALKFAGPVAASFGVDIETANAALGKLGDAGIQATLAGTGFRGTLAALASPSSEASARIEDLVGSLDQVDVTSRGLVPVLESLRTANLGVVDAFDIFGRRNAGVALTLTRTSRQIKALIELQREGAGAAEKFGDIQEDNLAGSFRTLRAAVEEAYLATGDAGYTGTLRGLVDASTSAIRLLTGTAEAADRASTTAQALARAMEFAAVAGAGLVALRLASYFATATRAMLAFNVAASASPLSLLARGAVAVGATIVAVGDDFDTSTNKVQALTKGVVDLDDAVKALSRNRTRITDASGVEDEEKRLALSRERLQLLEQARRRIEANADRTKDPRRTADLSALELIPELNRSALIEAALRRAKESAPSIDEFVFGPDNFRIDPDSIFDVESAKATRSQRVFTDNAESRTIRAAQERRRGLAEALSPLIQQGLIKSARDIPNEIIREFFQVVRVDSETAAEALRAAEDQIRERLGNAVEQDQKQTIAERAALALRASLDTIDESLDESIKAMQQGSVSRVDETTRAIAEAVERARQSGATPEQIADIEARVSPALIAKAKQEDELAASIAKRLEMEEKAAKAAAEQVAGRQRAEERLEAMREELRLLDLTADELEVYRRVEGARADALQRGVTLSQEYLDETRALALAIIAGRKAKEDDAKAELERTNAMDRARLEVDRAEERAKRASERLKERRADASQSIRDLFRETADEQRFTRDLIGSIGSGGNPREAENIRERIEAQREIARLTSEAGVTNPLLIAQSVKAYDAEIVKLQELRLELERVEQQRQFFDDIGRTTANGLYDLVTATDDWRSALARLVEQLGRLSFDTFAAPALQNLFSSGAQSLFGGFNILPNANGGILPGSIDFQAFANGGIATRPTLALIREAGQNEAVVPLPDGRSIPVELNLPTLRKFGGGSTTNNTDNSRAVNIGTVNVGGGGRGSGRRRGDGMKRSGRQLAADLSRVLRGV